MKRFQFLPFLFLLTVLPAFGEDVSATPMIVTPGPVRAIDPKAPAAWGDWFEKNTTVTDKGDYVHFFWNAEDCKAYFAVKDRKGRLAEAALQLVRRLAPKGTKAERMKIDIVYVRERDDYGMPKWDSLERVAHFEIGRSIALKTAKKKAVPAGSALKKLFEKVEFF